jgi:hypothetical protein
MLSAEHRLFELDQMAKIAAHRGVIIQVDGIAIVPANCCGAWPASCRSVQTGCAAVRSTSWASRARAQGRPGRGPRRYGPAQQQRRSIRAHQHQLQVNSAAEHAAEEQQQQQPAAAIDEMESTMTRAEQPVEESMDAPERRGEEAAPGKRQAVLASPAADGPPAGVALEMGKEMDAEMDKIADKEAGMEPGHAAGEAGGWCTVARRRSRHGLRGPVQGVQRMGAGRHVETVGKKMFRELARAARET